MLSVVALAMVACACQGQPPVAGSSGRLQVADALTGATGGFARADAPRRFRFPRDHGPHPDYRTEWWYLTGNLDADDGARFGYQLTFFRSALAAEMPERSSAWASRQAWMAHFAVTDVTNRSFRAFERFSRAGLGLAGARARPLRVWLDDWWMFGAPGGSRGPGDDPASIFPLRLHAAEDDVLIDLQLAPIKPPVLHGRDGLSQKGSGPGNASYYYSLTRLDTEGTLTVGERRSRVDGLSWLDREWSTSALEEDQSGWDWFSLQLTDGWDLMFYRLRRLDGSTDPHSAGSLVGPTGQRIPLDVAAVDLAVTEIWTSPRDGTHYPSGWILRIPAHGIELSAEPLLADQELDLSFRYWEGAVSVDGIHRGAAVEGSGYVELTGYGDDTWR